MSIIRHAIAVAGAMFLASLLTRLFLPLAKRLKDYDDRRKGR